MQRQVKTFHLEARIKSFDGITSEKRLLKTVGERGGERQVQLRARVFKGAGVGGDQRKAGRVKFSPRKLFTSEELFPHFART